MVEGNTTLVFREIWTGNHTNIINSSAYQLQIFHWIEGNEKVQSLYPFSPGKLQKNIKKIHRKKWTVWEDEINCWIPQQKVPWKTKNIHQKKSTEKKISLKGKMKSNPPWKTKQNPKITWTKLAVWEDEILQLLFHLCCFTGLFHWQSLQRKTILRGVSPSLWLPGLSGRVAATVVCDGHWAGGHRASSGGEARTKPAVKWTKMCVFFINNN